MTSLKTKLKILEQMTVANSPVILTAVGVAGTIATAVLTYKAATKSAHTLILEDAKRTSETPDAPVLTNKDIVKLTWLNYGPPVAAGAITIGAIVMSNRISTKRAAGLAAAYTIAERAHSEYKDKIEEKFGKVKADAARAEIAQDQVDQNPPNTKKIIR